MDYVCSLIKPNADQVIMVYDVGGLGYANMYPELAKTIIATSSKLFVSRVYRLYVINSSFTSRMMYNSMKTFLHERSRRKVQFLPPAPHDA